MNPEEKRVRRIAKSLASRLGPPPETAVILGSGLGGARLGRVRARLSYRKITGFPKPGVSGHAGELSLVGRAAVLCGRAHYYEGHSIAEVVRPVRVMAAWGVKALVVTNASGGIRRTRKPGDLMLITDHLNLMGVHPLRGENLEGLGPRFPDMTEAYDPALGKLALKTARRLGIPLKQGVYAAVSGPSYETPAEIRMLAALGAHAVGMSTVPEVLAAVHAGMRVLGISCVSNAAAGLSKEILDHESVKAIGARTGKRLGALLHEILAG